MIEAIDWDTTFRPAILALLNGEAFNIYNPPWVLFPLIPFAVMGSEGRVMMLLFGLLSFLLAIKSLGAGKLGTVAVLLSPFVYESLAWGNVEWLALLGVAATPTIGILLLMIKPQMTFGLILLKLIARKDRARVAILVAAVTLLSFMFFGFWPLKTLSYNQFVGSEVNLALFPWAIPAGIILLFIGLRFKKQWAALAASPLFMHVLTPNSWAGIFVAMSKFTRVSVLGSVVMWLIVLSRYL
ncbi:MAG TPA: hypothetical protein VIH42_06095 [Thermoguttaceae bacterium]